MDEGIEDRLTTVEWQLDLSGQLLCAALSMIDMLVLRLITADPNAALAADEYLGGLIQAEVGGDEYQKELLQRYSDMIQPLAAALRLQGATALHGEEFRAAARLAGGIRWSTLIAPKEDPPPPTFQLIDGGRATRKNGKAA